MKARVKATGEIIEISEDCSCLYAENYDKSYNLNELEFLDVKEKSFPKDEPDYWEKLTHQAAIGAMQVMLASGVPTSLQYQYTKEADHHNVIADEAVKFAVSLVTKIKNHDEENKVQGNPRG